VYVPLHSFEVRSCRVCEAAPSASWIRVRVSQQFNRRVSGFPLGLRIEGGARREDRGPGTGDRGPGTGDRGQVTVDRRPTGDR
jgi:hypothetical protein